jgi:hypothetical protein
MAVKTKAEKSPAKLKTTRKPARKTTKSAASKKTVAPKVETAMQEPKGLLGIQDHFKVSWELFKKTFLSYLKLVGIGIGLFFVIGIVGLIIALPLLLSSGGSAPSLFSNPSPGQIAGIVLVILWAIVSALAILAYLLFLPLANVLILDSKDKVSLETLFKKTKRLLVPYLLVSIVVGLLVAGGWILFVLPGLVISLLFIFVAYIFVLEDKHGIAALKRSYQLVKEHFWAVVLRVLIVQGIIFLGSVVFDNLAEQSDFFSLVSFVFSIVAGWFAQAYMYLLYKQVRAQVPSASASSIKWVVIVSVIGWVLLLGFIAAATSGLIQMPDLQQSVETMNEDMSTLETT